ncbi:MAG: riboflavin synthase [Alphaproteobacteria bacterium]|nr:riboflavin synthase [Alphaproteobacteria bacterium]
MFTGIITDVGKVEEARHGDGLLTVTIATAYDTAKIALGASIGCSGVCLTAVTLEPGRFTVEVSSESLARSTIGDWCPGTRVNLEQAMRLGDEMGGHLVQGHVDGVARVTGRQPDGESVRFAFDVPAALAPFIAPKGAVALDGVSLTVNEVDGHRFGVNIIPHTLAHTTFGEARSGTRMNLEIDLIARYVGRLLDARGAA